MRLRLAWLAVALTVPCCARTVTVPVPGSGTGVQADLYGSGSRAILLTHGGQFDRQSWRPQAEHLARAGFLVMALSFRGDRLNPDGTAGSVGSDAENGADVLAAVAYLRAHGVDSICAVGASMGGNALGEAEAQSKTALFDRVVFFGTDGGDHPERLKGRTLFLTARDDVGPGGPRLRAISEAYRRAPEPKELAVVSGSPHAQHLFATAEGPEVLKRIEAFLLKP